jgi:hypothetical protein
MGGMDQFACIFFQMNPFDSHRVGLTVIPHNFEGPVFAKWAFILRDLISFGQVRIEIIFSCKSGTPIDPAVEGQSGTDTVLNRLFVQDRKGTGLARADRADMTVRR